MARAHTETMVRVLASVANSSEADGARVQAAGILLDRGWGKAEQVHSGGVDGDIRITIRTILEDTRAKVIEGKVNDKPK